MSTRRLSWPLLFTSLAWLVVGAAAGWVLVALGWWLIALLWWRELLVPHGVGVTAKTIAVVTAWAVSVLLSSAWWARYNYRRHFLKNRRQLEPLESARPRPQWAEAILDPDNGSQSVEKLGRSLLLDRSAVAELSLPARLSWIAVLNREGSPTEAANLARKALEEAVPGSLFRTVAARELALALARVSRTGRQLATVFVVPEGGQARCTRRS